MGCECRTRIGSGITDRLGIIDIVAACVTVVCAAGADSYFVEEKSPLRILTVTTLYPNTEMPNHGIFVENRLRQLVETGQVTARVVAPVPMVSIRVQDFRKVRALRKSSSCRDETWLAGRPPKVCCCTEVGHVFGANSPLSIAEAPCA